MRACPYCSAQISDYVIKCVPCGRWLVEDPPVYYDRNDDPVERAVDEVVVVSEPVRVQAQVAPPIPGGGHTLDPVIILPDEEPAGA